MALNVPDPARPVDHLEVGVDGRQVEAELTRFPLSEHGPRQPRWMLRIDGGPVLRGPLTWEGALDPEVERTAIVAFVRDRQQVASRYRTTHGELLHQLRDAGMLEAFANALGVMPGELLSEEPEKR